MQHCDEIHGTYQHYHDIITVVVVMMVPDKNDQKFKIQHTWSWNEIYGTGISLGMCTYTFTLCILLKESLLVM